MAGRPQISFHPRQRYINQQARFASKMINNFLLVGLGGGVGSMLRYLCQKWLNYNEHNFPWGTFVVNIVGCLIIGVVYAASAKGTGWSPQARLLLTAGFCGGFTTFSSFSAENLNFLREG